MMPNAPFDSARRSVLFIVEPSCLVCLNSYVRKINGHAPVNAKFRLWYYKRTLPVIKKRSSIIPMEFRTASASLCYDGTIIPWICGKSLSKRRDHHESCPH